MYKFILFNSIISLLFLFNCSEPLKKKQINIPTEAKEKNDDIYVSEYLERRWKKDDARKIRKEIMKINTLNGQESLLGFKNNGLEGGDSDRKNLTFLGNSSKQKKQENSKNNKKFNENLIRNNSKEINTSKLIKNTSNQNNNGNSNNNLYKKTNDIIDKHDKQKGVEVAKPRKIINKDLFNIEILDLADRKRPLIGKWSRIDPPNPKGDYFVGGWKSEEIQFDTKGYMTIIRTFGKNTIFKSICDYKVHLNNRISFGKNKRPEKITKPITMYHDEEIPILKPPTQNLPAILSFKIKKSSLIIDGVLYEKLIKKTTAP